LLLLLLLLTRAIDVVLVLDGDTLGHVVDLVHADEACCELKHIVAQRNDNELGVLGTLLDIIRNNGDLMFMVRIQFLGFLVALRLEGLLTFRKSKAASISSMT
jgi:hypothetical protein